MKVLLPLDRSAESEQVVPLMLAEAPPDTEYTLLRVLGPVITRVYEDTVSLGLGTVAVGSEIEQAEVDESLNYLSGVVRKYDGLPSNTRCEALIAPTSSQGIVDFAEEEGMDLIAMFVRERTGIAKLVKGRTARNVTRTSKVEFRIFGPSDLHATKNEDRVYLSGEAALADCQLFHALTPEQREVIWALGETESVEPGTILAQEGDLGLKLYVILSGEAQLTASSAVGRIPVRVAKAGDAFPAASLLGANALITGSTAMTPMKVLAITSVDLITLCHEDPTIGVVVFAEAAKVFATRYSDTLRHLARALERESTSRDT